MSTPDRFASAGRLGALVRWGNTVDRAAATEPARRALADRWIREVREEHPDLDDQAVQLMAEARKKAHYTRLAHKSAAARRARMSRRAA